MRNLILFLLINLTLYPVVHAAVVLPEIFSDHSVLQTGRPVPVWGTAKAGERVTVEFAGQRKEATVDAHGNWMIKLDPMPVSSEPRTMTIRSSNFERSLRDILVGEVWLCSGQSNMYMPLGASGFSKGVIGGEAEIARPEQPELRLYCNANHKEWKGAGLTGWQRANSASRPLFSATAYFFGNAIQKDLSVPVGLINISAGGSSITPWTPKEAALSVPIVRHYQELFEENKIEIGKHQALMNRYQEVWRQRHASGPTTNPPPIVPDPLPYNLFMAQRLGTSFGLYESFIAPIVPYALRGVIWYQGEANADNLELSNSYEEMLRTLITSWRDSWKQPELPFYFVQLPCWNSDHASTWHINRQGMLNVLRSMPSVGMAVTVDVGDINNLHPANKRPVGERLALWALAKTYGKPIVFSGPIPRELASEGDKLRVQFDTCGSALKLHGPAWTNLEVAGDDGLYYPATATISADTAIVGSASVPRPVSVRYGWKPVFTPTLFNTEGLPASPFAFPPPTPVTTGNGADKAKGVEASKEMAASGKNNYSYLGLVNHRGPSGVPVGGAGVGCFDYAPDGAFTRVAINNWHSDGGGKYCVENVPGSFIAVWRDGQARVLRRSPAAGEGTYAGMLLAHKTVYKGLFPIAECQFDDTDTVRVWSGLVPQNVKDSSLPLAWIEVEVSNPDTVPKPVAVAFSWQDVIGRNIRDILDPNMVASMKDKPVWDRNALIKAAADAGKDPWGMAPRVATFAKAYEAEGFRGILQNSAPIKSNLKTYQNYNNEIAVMAQSAPDTEMMSLASFDVDSSDAAWESFRTKGRFPAASTNLNDKGTSLFVPGEHREKASAVALRAILKPGEKRTMRFLVAWFQPEIDMSQAPPGSYFGKADYGRYYMNSFKDIGALVTYAGGERERIERETRSWQKPILESTFPEWLKFKVINSAYTLYTNTILNKAGDFTVMEGGMGGLAGTMDQRISAHPFYFKFFTQLDRSDLELFGHTQGPEGQILHFDGHYYYGLASRDGTTPVPRNCMNDNSGGWLLQVAKDYQQSGDIAWLSQFRDVIPRVLAYLHSRVRSKNFDIISGSTTYDDFWHPDIYAYNATTWPAFLKAGAVLYRALGEPAAADQCEQESKTAANDALRALWNGRFFAYGANLDGSERRDDIMFSGQLGGQFMSRCFGLGDVLPMNVTRASIVAQLKTNIAHSADYYAPKVWLVKEQKGMNDPRHPDRPNASSTCWPFYLESYTAMAAIQAGYVDDGLDMMKHIQLVNLRNGWTWSQDLWQPSELTYVAAPVSWFITDVLAGSALDLSSGVLALAPILRDGETETVVPVYFPGFWATVRANRKTHSLKLEITRVFGSARPVLKRVVICPVGVPTADQRVIDIYPFSVQEGAVLDLSSHWDGFDRALIQSPVLPNADKVSYLEVPK